MLPEEQVTTLETLEGIRNIMDRSTRFISLSGWSGIWAGCTALAGAAIAYMWMQQPGYVNIEGERIAANYRDASALPFILLALGVIVVAFAGGLFFTLRKANNTKQPIWNTAAKQMLLSFFFPMVAGALFALAFIYNGCGMFVAPACLAFYGLALITASRYTLSLIRYLGMLEVALGCTSLFFPGYGLYFWAAGFGVLHIVYGTIMWKKYDKQEGR